MAMKSIYAFTIIDYHVASFPHIFGEISCKIVHKSLLWFPLFFPNYTRFTSHLQLASTFHKIAIACMILKDLTAW